MQNHLALMQMLAAMHGSPQGRMLNQQPLASSSPPDQGVGYAPDGNPEDYANMGDPAANGDFGFFVGRTAPKPSDRTQQLAQALLGNTRNPRYSNMNALHHRFAQNNRIAPQ